MRRSPADISPIPASRRCQTPWNLAFPIAEVEPDGSAVHRQGAGTGGAVDLMTVKEQMLYEVHDPANYITPDVVVDFTTTAARADLGPDRVRVSGIGGKPRTPTLKVSIGCTEGFIGEDMFFYAGPGAIAPGATGEAHPRRALPDRGPQAEEMRIDFLGVNAIHGEATPRGWTRAL